MKKIIEYLVNDYKIVSDMVHEYLNFKIPEWMILIYYIVMVPIGAILCIFIKIWTKVLSWKLSRSIENN